MNVVIQTKTNSAGIAKQWPYFEALLSKFPDVTFTEVLVLDQKPTEGAVPFYGTRLEIIDLIKKADAFVSIDSWLQHLAAWQTNTKGVVIFSRSNPAIFGYPKFTNVFKSPEYFKKFPYEAWYPSDLDINAFPSVEQVADALSKLLHKN